MSITTQNFQDNPLSDNQRRVLCRVVFILFCAIPTLWMIYLLLHPETPAQWSQLLQSQTGLVTTIDDIETPGPRWRILRGVTFADPELGPLLSAAEVEIVYGDKINHMMVKNQSLKITSRALKRLSETFSKNVLNKGPVDRQWQIHIDKAIIESDIVSGQYQESLVVAPLSIVVANDSGDQSTVAHLQFQIFGEPETQPINCQLIRYHAHSKLESESWIDTGDARLPVWLAWDMSPDLRKLGDQCHFTGHAHRAVHGLGSTLATVQPESKNGFASTANRNAGRETVRNTVRAKGNFQHVNLASLVQSTGHRLTGTCDAAVHEFVLEDAQIKQLNFEARCPQGTVATSLLKAMEKRTSIYMAEAFQLSQLDFQSLRFNCELQEGFFKISNPGFGYRGGEQLAVNSNNQPILLSMPEIANSLDSLADVLFQPLNDSNLISEEKKALLAKFQLPSTRSFPTRISDRGNKIRLP